MKKLFVHEKYVYRGLLQHFTGCESPILVLRLLVTCRFDVHSNSLALLRTSGLQLNLLLDAVYKRKRYHLAEKL